MANIATDAFTGADNTDLSAHDAHWVKVTGFTDTAVITSNRLRILTVLTSGAYLYNVDPGTADYEVSADFLVDGNTNTALNCGVIARASSSQTIMYMARWRASNGFSLFKFEGSTTATQLGSSVAHSYGAGTTGRIRLRVNGSTISVFRGNETTPIISVTDTSITDAGFAGIWAGSNATSNDGPHLDSWTADTLAINAVAEGGTGTSAGSGSGGDAATQGDAVISSETGVGTGSGSGGEAVGGNASFTVKANAIWTWFTDPRAVHYNGNTYIGWVNSSGDVGITKWDHSTDSVTSFTLHATLEADDHNNVAIHIRQDGRILAIYSKHNDVSGLRYRISTNAEDISAWGAEVVLSSGLTLPISYSNPFYLSQSGKTYNFFRSGTGGSGTNPIGIIESTDGGSTWSAQTTFLTNTGQRPYVKWVSNGIDRIDFLITNCHPNESAASIYHFYGRLDGSNAIKYYKSDGTLIGNSVTPADCTLIYDGSTNDAWVFDIAYGSDGRPRVLFVKYATTSDQRFMFSRWSGTAWTAPVEITNGGAYLYDPEVYYSGGLCFDSRNPNHVYLVTPVAGVREVQEWETPDNGSTWGKRRDITAGTSAGVINARPHSPRNRSDELAVLYWSGTYASYTSYSTNLKGAAASFFDGSDAGGDGVGTGSGSGGEASSGQSGNAEGGEGVGLGSGSGGDASGQTGGSAYADGGTGTVAGSGSGGEATAEQSGIAEGGTGTGAGSGSGGGAIGVQSGNLPGVPTDGFLIVGTSRKYAIRTGSLMLPKKSPTEDIVIEFSFSSRLETGDTINSVVSVTATACVGHDENASGILNGQAEVSTNRLSVYVPVTGGIMGIHYLITVVIVDSTGERRTLYGQLPIGIAP